MSINDIKFGNPAKEHVIKVKKDKAGVLKKCLELGIVDDILKNHPYPANDSDETKKELDYLVKITGDASDEEVRICELVETNHYDIFSIFGKKLGINVSSEKIESWVTNVDPVLFYLKDKFNRARPYQLADAMNIPLYPIIRTDANSAAYPSGHTLDFLVILHHFGKMKPESAKELKNFYEQIKKIREVSGVHYPSDRKISEYLFQNLVKNKII